MSSVLLALVAGFVFGWNMRAARRPPSQRLELPGERARRERRW